MTCKHRWEEGTNKERPAYRCARCGQWRFIDAMAKEHKA